MSSMFNIIRYNSFLNLKCVYQSSYYITKKRLSHGILKRCLHCTQLRLQQAETAPLSAGQAPGPAAPMPTEDSCDRQYSETVTHLVEQIVNLPLLEVADLNHALKKRLNLPDAPVIPAGMMMPGMAASAQSQDAPKEEEVAQKTSFAIKLVKFDESKKIALIKEIKSIMPDMNLVQAKKFVESLPQVVKDDLGKQDADKLKDHLATVGGSAEIE